MKQTDEKGNPLTYWGGLEQPKQDMKQTAVEWLLNNLISEPHSEEDFQYNSDMWDKAIEMERQQIKEAYLRGIENYDPTFKNK